MKDKIMNKSLYSFFLKFISMLLFLFCWLIIGFSEQNSDFDTYKLMYDTVNSLGIESYSGLEIGQRWLYSLGGHFGLEYSEFLKIYTFLGLILLWKGIGYLNTNRIFTIILYFIFPFAYDVTQVRNFFAMCIVIYAFHFLLKKGFYKSVVPYTLIIFLATLVHSISLFYLIFLLVKIKDYKYFYFCSFFLTVLMVFAFRVLNLISYFSERTNVYGEESGQAGLFYAILYLGLFIFNILINRYFYLNSKNNLKSEDIKTNEVVYKASILLFCAFPLVLVNNIFFRIFRNFMIIMYASTTYGISKNIEKKPYGSSFFFILLIVFVVINSYVWLFSAGKFYTIIQPILEYNSLLGR